MPTQPPPKAAAILVRISDDRAGDAAGVGRQEQDTRRLADQLGWVVGEVVVENDTSAFKRRKVALPGGGTAMRVDRPEFRRLLDLIAAGSVDGLIAYHLDRVARDPRDLEDLIDVVEASRIPVESVTGSIRLDTDSGIAMSRFMVTMANQSSRDTARRTARKHEELASRGLPAGGVRRFGFAKNGIDHEPREVAALRWVAQEVLAGASVSSTTKRLDERGIRPVKAERWSSKSLTDILISPRLAGLRVHHGEVAGPAVWSPVFDQETHERLVATIRSRGRGYVQPKLVRWCNQLLFCALCQHTLSGTTMGKNRPPSYWCNPRTGGCGRISITALHLERELEGQVVRLLGRQHLPAAEPAAPPRVPVGEATELEDKLRLLARMWAQGDVTLAEFTEARQVLDARLRDLRRPVHRRPPVSRHAREMLAGKQLVADFPSAPPEVKREVTRLVLRANGLSGWTVDPSEPGKPRRFDPQRLTLASGVGEPGVQRREKRVLR